MYWINIEKKSDIYRKYPIFSIFVDIFDFFLEKIMIFSIPGTCRPRTTYSRSTQRGTFCRRGTIEATLARCHAVQTVVQDSLVAVTASGSWRLLSRSRSRQQVMVDSVEGCCEVEHAKSRHLTVVCSNQQIAEHLRHRRLGAVEPAICRLHFRHQSIAVEECLDTCLNNLLQQL